MFKFCTALSQKNSLALLLVAALLMPSVSYAKKSDSSASGAIDAKTFDVLNKAQAFTESGEYKQAIATLDSIKSSPKLNSYAKSQMWNFYAFIYASQEQYKNAIGAYKKLIAEPDAPAGLVLTSKYTLAQLYFQIEDYKSVIHFMEAWLKEIKKPTSTAHILLAQAYYESKSYQPAIKNLDKAIALSKAEGKPLDENWLRMKAAIYFDSNDIKNTLNTYKQLLKHFPKENYLRQIAGLYGEVGNSRKRLTTYDALYQKGSLTKESDVLNLAYMYLGEGIPYKAGKIIETGMKNGQIERSPKNIETLANAWAQANEHKKAIPTLQKAAELSDKGLLYARLAGVYFDAGDYAKCANAAQKAADKGGLKRKDSNHMLMGMALFNIQHYEDALQAFRQAKKSKKTFSDAREWEKYTLKEIERLRVIAQSKFELSEKNQQTLQASENNVDAIGAKLINN